LAAVLILIVLFVVVALMHFKGFGRKRKR